MDVSFVYSEILSLSLKRLGAQALILGTFSTAMLIRDTWLSHSCYPSQQPANQQPVNEAILDESTSSSPISRGHTHMHTRPGSAELAGTCRTTQPTRRLASSNK